MSGQREDPELTELASALRTLQPRPETLDHAALMYRAGQASARGGLWPLATMLSLAVALALGIIAWTRSEPVVIERTVSAPAANTAPERNDGDVPSPAVPSPSGDADAWSSYVHLQEKVVEGGLEGLPALPNTPEPSADLEALLRAL
jgi:hypothetical protein